MSGSSLVDLAFSVRFGEVLQSGCVGVGVAGALVLAVRVDSSFVSICGLILYPSLVGLDFGGLTE